jgi:formylglycine-generating enzyme
MRTQLYLRIVVFVCSIVGLLGAARAAEPEGNRWALLIGVDKCKALGELKVCAADARGLKRVLTQVGYRADHINLLVDDTTELESWPTLAGTRRGITRLAQVAEKGDTILLFFSGHGVMRGKEGFIVPSDGDPNQAIALAWVRAELDKSKATRKVLILDTCHAGAAKGVTGIAPDAAAATGIFMLLSSDKDQVSWPDNDFGHGVFTRYLIEGLSGKAADADRNVTFAQLANYVHKGVRAWTFTNRKELQTPVAIPESNDPTAMALVVARVPAQDIVLETRKRKPTVYEAWPFDTTEAKHRQQATAEALGIPVEKTLDLGGGVKLELVLIPAGEFQMGSPANEAQRDDDEGPQHKVRITKPFYMGRHEVTREQFARFIDATRTRTDAEKEGSGYGMTKDGFKLVDGLSWRKPGIEQGANHPVVQVSWNDAVAFCKWLAKKTGATVALPTEAEWEYACRAGADTRFWFGTTAEDGKGKLNWCDQAANRWIGQYNRKFDEAVGYDDGYGTTAPVGRFAANAFGLYDMHGNVWEWCSDWYGTYDAGAKVDPPGPATGQYRVLRGGSWDGYPRYCRSAGRGGLTPAARYNGYGFRLICRDF